MPYKDALVRARAGREDSRRNLRHWAKWFHRLKLQRGCGECGYRECAAALDFHHRDPAMKRMQVSSMHKHSHRNVMIEIDKCDLLCANCHRRLECRGRHCPHDHVPVSSNGVDTDPCQPSLFQADS